MKKILTILAVSLVSMNFVSCREDSMDLETAETTMPQARKTNSKVVADSIVSADIVTNNVANRPEGDPDKDPPRDRTRW